MKHFIVSIIALLMFSIATVPVAEAKRFGGGKSFGKSFKTAPAPKQNTSSLNQSNAQKNNANKAATNNSRKGLFGGILGGLLAGGLLAAFFGGAFEGIQFMDILIFGLLGYLIFRLIKNARGVKPQPRANQNAYQGAGQNQSFDANMQNFERQSAENQGTFGANTGAQTGGFGATGQSDVPYNFPPGFDAHAFVEGSREHYRTIQGAWNYNQLDTIQEYVDASLFESLKAERVSLEGEQHTEVMYVDAEIVRGDYNQSKAELSLQFSGRYRDSAEGVEEDIDEIWHLERDLTRADQPWLIVGIQTN